MIKVEQPGQSMGLGGTALSFFSSSLFPPPHRFQKKKACPDGEKCRCAHGQEELTEWLDRREVLKQKLAKARNDMLLCPMDNDFGKYNFLLQDNV